MSDVMDAIDKRILNAMQDGFPVSDRPFAQVARELALDEDELIERVRAMCADGRLSRFGPLFNAERLGGDVTLAAMAVPRERFDAVAATVNAHPEVAHNYERRHPYNMWFVISAETPERVQSVIAEIEGDTGLAVLNMPKEREFFVGLRFVV